MYVYNVYTVQVVPYNVFFFLIFYCGVLVNVPTDHDPRRALGSGEVTEREPAPGRYRENQQHRYSNDISTNVLCFAVAADAGIRFAVTRNSYLLLFYVQKSIVKPIVIFSFFFFPRRSVARCSAVSTCAAAATTTGAAHEAAISVNEMAPQPPAGRGGDIVVIPAHPFYAHTYEYIHMVNDKNEMNSCRNVRRNATRLAGLGTLVVYSKTTVGRQYHCLLHARDLTRRLFGFAGTDLRFCEILLPTTHSHGSAARPSVRPSDHYMRTPVIIRRCARARAYRRSRYPFGGASDFANHWPPSITNKIFSLSLSLSIINTVVERFRVLVSRFIFVRFFFIFTPTTDFTTKKPPPPP